MAAVITGMAHHTDNTRHTGAHTVLPHLGMGGRLRPGTMETATTTGRRPVIMAGMGLRLGTGDRRLPTAKVQTALVATKGVQGVRWIAAGITGLRAVTPIRTEGMASAN